VLADFDRFFIDNYKLDPREYEKEFGQNKFWSEIENFPGGFFRQLPKMPDAVELVEAVRHLNPIILTGAPKGSEWPRPQKEAWRDEHFPGIPMICCQSKRKSTHMVNDKHNVIIDDWPKWKHIWEENGGTFILHTSAKESINSLRDNGFLYSSSSNESVRERSS
jgi:5'(3')-deoxyribonucleotidase